MRLVLVDDEPDVLLLLKVQLALLDDLEVVGTAADGAEALEVISRVDPDAVVMDLLMPGMSGFEAIGVLRQERPHVAVVAYSGVAGEFVRTEMDRLGVPVVLKSGDPVELAAALREAVSNRL